MVLRAARIRIIQSLLICCIIIIPLNAAELIKGDPYAVDTTYSFSVNKIVRDPVDDAIFVGAQDAGAGMYALSGIHPKDPGAQPLTPQTVNLNNQDSQPNPLYNQGITFLDIIDGTDGRRSPIMVASDDLTRVYLLRDFNNINSINVFSTAPLLDATMQVTPGIVGIVGFRGAARSAALAAVAPSYTGIFGNPGSGFTVLSFDQFNQETPGAEGKPPTVKTMFGFKQFSGAAFDRTSPTISITAPVASLTSDLAMNWNRLLQVGYVGFQLVGGSNGSDGARSLMIADVNGAGAITLRQFAPNSAFDNADNQIIGGIGASIPLSIQFIANMDTSTALSYIIVQGGNGTPAQTANTVYALPIINARNRYGSITDPTIQGVLASKNSSVFTFYSGLVPSRFMFRRFEQPAVTPADTPRSTDPAVLVGGGPIPTGTIQSLNVSLDAVMVSVSEAPEYYEPCKTGMFISQAMFDETGKIKAWTPWEHMGGVVEPIFRNELSTDTGNVTYFTGANAQSINSVFRTQWGFGSPQGLGQYAEQINLLYPAISGGVQSITNVPFGTTGLNGISMLIAGGLNSVTLAEVGAEQAAYGNQPCPHTSGYNNITFADGTISGSIPSNTLMLTIQGGALNNVGPITTTAIGVNSVTHEGYLFVGGSLGVAVLTAPNGAGWASGLGPNFAGLTTGMSFRTLNNYSFVRKLVVDGNFLYVISGTRVDRIDLSTAPTFTTTTIASQSSLVFDKNDIILDGIMSGKLGLLATSKGLFRTSNGSNVSTVTTDNNASWTSVPIPLDVVPPQQMLISSTTGNPTDVARDNGGMIQILSAFLGLNRARVNRFSIKDVSATSIDDTTVLPIPDGEIQDVIGSFITFNGYRSSIASDGALMLNTIGRALMVSPYIRTRGFRSGTPVPLSDGNGTLINQVLRSSTSGSWLVAGDFGIRLNE